MTTKTKAGRPCVSKESERDLHIVVRMNAAEKKALVQCAERSGKSVSAYLRDIATGANHKPYNAASTTQGSAGRPVGSVNRENTRQYAVRLTTRDAANAMAAAKASGERLEDFMRSGVLNYIKTAPINLDEESQPYFEAITASNEARDLVPRDKIVAAAFSGVEYAGMASYSEMYKLSVSDTIRAGVELLITGYMSPPKPKKNKYSPKWTDKELDNIDNLAKRYKCRPNEIIQNAVNIYMARLTNK